jgi:uncharacterized membrane protein YcaP (DUF421 family)
MAGNTKSITEALLLIGTIASWDYLLDFLGFRSAFFSRILEPGSIVLIKNGRIIRRNLEKEMITEEELMSNLRQQGIENVSDVKQCSLESNGEFSIIRNDGEANRGNKKKPGAVN